MNWHIYPCGILSQGLYYICSTPIPPIMTTISLTSGEVLDIISALCDKEQALYDADNLHLAAYYLHIIQQFENISHRLEELPGEERVANLVMAL
jgi:hypothetical protein